MNEFSLIDTYFKKAALARDDVLFGIGDDAACVRVPMGEDLLISTDTLVEGVHFLSDWDPADIAYRAVMVNISDLAAMAAKPVWATLALTLPQNDATWLRRFSQGLHKALTLYGISLIGGDTTCGPLTITITIHGTVPENGAIRRNGAGISDIIWLSGEIGAAALAVSLLNPSQNAGSAEGADSSEKQISPKDLRVLMKKLQKPTPRIDLNNILQRFATSAIDISDGLSADLHHIAKASSLSARLALDAIPIHPIVRQQLADKALDFSLQGGDDYELCFTTKAETLNDMRAALKIAGLTCYPIGMMVEGRGLYAVDNAGAEKALEPNGYTHF